MSLHASVAQQTRDLGTPPVTGTASISGVVFDDQDPARPVRRAVVTLTGAGLHPSRGAITDDDGRFALRGLPAGRFMLTAERGGYVTSVYGARRPGRAGTAITVDDGQQIADLRVRIWRGAVLAGVLRDESGAPLPNTAVAAVPAREATPVTLTLSNGPETRTNDLGEYRIFGLEPGAWVVRAGEMFAGSPTVTASDAEVDAIFAALAARRQPGAGVQAAAVAAPVRIEGPERGVSAAPIYFPGTAVRAEAVSIVLSAGEERSGLDFVVSRIRTATLRGIVTGPDGTPIRQAFVQLTSPAGAASEPVGSFPTGQAYSGADGTFTIASVAPGDYRLLARGAVASGALWWTETAVVVAGDDIDLAPVTLERGMTFSGRVTVAAGSSGQPQIAGLRIQLEAASLAQAPTGARRGGTPGPRFLRPGVVDADGTFTVTDLIPDTYRVTVTGGVLSGSGWWLRSVMHQGRDLLDVPLSVAVGADISGVQVVLSDRRTELSGTLTTASGAAFPDVFVLAFPADPALRLPNARRIQAVRPDSSGRFVFANLPPGNYLICALTDIDDGQWNEEGFLESLVGASVGVTLGEGEAKVQDLRVGGGLQADAIPTTKRRWSDSSSGNWRPCYLTSTQPYIWNSTKWMTNVQMTRYRPGSSKVWLGDVGPPAHGCAPRTAIRFVSSSMSGTGGHPAPPAVVSVVSMSWGFVPSS